VVHPASVQDRDGAEPLLRRARRLFPFVERIIGDAGYQGPKMAAAAARTGRWKVEIVRRCDRHRFVVLPKRVRGRTPNRRANAGLDQSLPPSCARFRTARTHRRRLPAHGHDPHHAQAPRAKALNVNPNFQNRLLGLAAVCAEAVRSALRMIGVRAPISAIASSAMRDIAGEVAEACWPAPQAPCNFEETNN
jgi:transposase